MGWAGEVGPYMKSQQLVKCPDDNTGGTYTCSYALNEWLPTNALAVLAAPASTVLCFEVTGATANPTAIDENATGNSGWGVSAVGDGWPDPGPGNSYLPNDLADVANCSPLPCTNGAAKGGPAVGGVYARHDANAANSHGGHSEYLLADGHVKYIDVDYVSRGQYPTGNSNIAGGPNCSGNVTAVTCVATFNPNN